VQVPQIPLVLAPSPPYFLRHPSPLYLCRFGPTHGVHGFMLTSCTLLCLVAVVCSDQQYELDADVLVAKLVVAAPVALSSGDQRALQRAFPGAGPHRVDAL
jgi:hypothetical protein